MEVNWAVNLQDTDGEVCKKCILLFCGEDVILRHNSVTDLESFAYKILRAVSEIKESV